MSSPDFYIHEARQAELDAGRGRELAARLESNGGELGSHLRRTRTEFTPEVWDSAVATSRRMELTAHSRRLGYVEDELHKLVVELRAFAQNRETDAVYFMQRYHSELLEQGVELGPS